MEKRDQFLMIPYKVLSASGYVNNHGECVKMNLSDKIIYCHLKNRFEFFKGLGKEYFDTQQSIANFCNMDLKATGNILRKFIKNDLTTIYKKPYNNYQKNVYTYVGNLSLWYKKNGKVESYIEEYEYMIPDNFTVDLPDIGYSRESEIGTDNLDIEWTY